MNGSRQIDHKANVAAEKARLSGSWTKHIEDVRKAMFELLPSDRLKSIAIALSEEHKHRGGEVTLLHLESLVTPAGVPTRVSGKLSKPEGDFLKKILNPVKYAGYDKTLPAWVVVNALKKGCLSQNITVDSKGRTFSDGIQIPPMEIFWTWYSQWTDATGISYLKKELGESTRLNYRGDQGGTWVEVKGSDGRDCIYPNSYDWTDKDTITASRRVTNRELVAAYMMKVFLMWHPDMDMDSLRERNLYLPGASSLSDVYGLLKHEHGIVRVGKDFWEHANGKRVAIPEIVMKKVGEERATGDDGAPSNDFLDTYVPTILDWQGEILQAALITKVFGQEIMK